MREIIFDNLIEGKYYKGKIYFNDGSKEKRRFKKEGKDTLFIYARGKRES